MIQERSDTNAFAANGSFGVLGFSSIEEGGDFVLDEEDIVLGQINEGLVVLYLHVELIGIGIGVDGAFRIALQPLLDDIFIAEEGRVRRWINFHEII